MATRYWVGGTGSQSWANLNNWSASEGGAGGASVPVAGDTVYINSGYSNINAGLDQSAVALAYLEVNFDGTLGTSSAPLKVSTSAGTMWFNCSQDCYVAAIQSAGSNILYVKMRGGATFFATSETNMDAAYLTGGNVVFSGTIANIYVHGTSLVVSGAGAASISQFSGKTIITNPAFTQDVYVYSGRITAVAGAPGTVNVIGPQSTYEHLTPLTLPIVLLTEGNAVCGSNQYPFTVTTSSKQGRCSLFLDAVTRVTYTNPPLQIGIP